MVQLFDTASVVVAGSASNDGVYTVSLSGRDSGDYNSIIVAESLVDEFSGNTITLRVKLSKAHADGDPVLWTADTRIPLDFYGYRADANTANASANRLAIQRANDDSYYTDRFTVLFPASGDAALIDNPVYQEREVPFEGTSPLYSIIKAHTTFPASAEKYMCHARVDGRVNAPSWYNNALARVKQSGLNWNGGSVASLGGGVFLTGQQPGQGLDDIRCQNFVDGTGLRIQETQQYDIGMIMLINNKINLHLRDAEHVTIQHLDTEQPGAFASGGCHVKMDSGGILDNLDFTILSGHIEDTSRVSYAFDISNAVGLHVVTYHSIASGSYTAYVRTGAGKSGALSDYDFYVTYSGSPTAAYALDDTDRSITTKAATVASNKRVHAFGTYPMRGATSVADGGTVTHGFGENPTIVNVTGTVSGEFVSVTAKSTTTFTVAIKKHDGTAGTTQTVYWTVTR
jgi:hypothetical protein